MLIDLICMTLELAVVVLQSSYFMVGVTLCFNNSQSVSMFPIPDHPCPFWINLASTLVLLDYHFKFSFDMIARKNM